MSPVGPPAAGAPDGRPTVVVVGGGITGLSAAWELSGGARADPDAPRVVVLESSGTPGGALQRREIAGEPVDIGPDGFLARRPEVVELCGELGIGGQLEPVAAHGAAVWVGGRRRPLPARTVLGVPTAVAPLARSGILGTAGILRLALDRVLPRPDRRGPLEDRAIGPLVSRKLGHQVVDRLVDPLVGGIHAGGVEDMSAAAVFPSLLTATRQRGSFMRALQGVAEGAPRPADGAPTFLTLRSGMGSLPGALVSALDRRGVEVRTHSPATSLTMLRPASGGGPRWEVTSPGGSVAASGIVLCAPAPAVASLLARHEPEAARTLRGFEHASVCVITFAFPTEDVPPDLYGTGLLVPRTTRIAVDPSSSSAPPGPALVTACTYLGRKWAHLERDGITLVRASAGRFGDDRALEMDDQSLVERSRFEIATLLGITAPPLAAHVTRWPGAFPQYQVHHLLRVAAVEAAVARLPFLAVAGATYHGIGIPACVASGRRAGREVRGALMADGSGTAAPSPSG